MGYTLYSTKKVDDITPTCDLGLRTWPAILELATKYGWTPEMPLGEYRQMCCTEVTADDAAQLAAAVERALPDIPVHDAVHVQRDGNFIDMQCGTVLEQLSGIRRRIVQNFVAFARRGAFRIM